MKNFERQSILRQNFFGIDSIQGLLELATWYNEEKESGFSFSLDDDTSAHGVFNTLKQLEKEEYINLEFATGKEGHVELKTITLTIKGHKLLTELRDKSGAGKIKKRLADLGWVVITSVITTVLVLWIKGV